MVDEERGSAPSCCGREMSQIRWGSSANFTIWIWRCSICEGFTSTNRRYDGETFWGAAMGRALAAKTSELLADAYASGGGPD